MTAADTLALLDWKRRIFALYARRPDCERPGDPAWRRWRDDPRRALPHASAVAAARSSPSVVPALHYWPYDPQARVLAELEDVDAAPQAIETSGPQPILFRPFARPISSSPASRSRSSVRWLEGYGGGAFLSFRDATSGARRYGGGRYLLDTVKGADLGEEDGRLVLDFNFAYNPSCSYDPGWVCPLAPPANRLPVAVAAGELHAA